MKNLAHHRHLAASVHDDCTSNNTSRAVHCEYTSGAKLRTRYVQTNEMERNKNGTQKWIHKPKMKKKDESNTRRAAERRYIIMWVEEKVNGLRDDNT